MPTRPTSMPPGLRIATAASRTTSQPGEHRMDRREAADAGTDRVTIVEVQWWERKKVAIVIDPPDRRADGHGPAQAKVLVQRAAAMGMPPVQVFHQMKRVYRRAFLGATVLEEGPAPAGDRFSYAFLTGDRDQNKGTWFGIVRPMLDPQRFANKWLSQTMDMLNRQSKGGHFAETSAVKDVRQFEASAAKPGATTWVNPGALRSGAIKEKPLPVLPSGHWQMMEFAIGSIRDSSGVNLELLGQQQNDQAGILEYHRKQAAMNILATAFNALRRARKHIGRVRLYFIQRYLSDGRSCGSPGRPVRRSSRSCATRPRRLRRHHRRGAVLAEPAAGRVADLRVGAADHPGHDHPAGAARGPALLAVPRQLRREDAGAARQPAERPRRRSSRSRSPCSRRSRRSRRRRPAPT